MNVEHKHIPELDGIRGIALLMMIFYHLQIFGFLKKCGDTVIWLLHLGWISIDLFFVLSGFLITSILLKTKNETGYFKKFYLRRILRIFPLYYLYLFLFFFIGSRTEIATHEKFKYLASNIFYFIFYAQNLFISLNKTVLWFGMNDLWSLAVEEQFYIFWPVIIYLSPKKRLKYIIGAFIGLALILRIILLAKASWVFTYFFTFTRFDSISFGALAAYLIHYKKDRQFQNVLAKFTGIIAIIGFVTIIVLQKHYALNGFYTNLIGFTFNGLLFFSIIVKIASGNINAITSRILRNPVFRFYGKISYCAYILHNPILQIFKGRGLIFYGSSAHVFFDSIIGNILFIFLYFLILSALAAISWNLFEKRILKLKRFVSY